MLLNFSSHTPSYIHVILPLCFYFHTRVYILPFALSFLSRDQTSLGYPSLVRVLTLGGGERVWCMLCCIWPDDPGLLGFFQTLTKHPCSPSSTLCSSPSILRRNLTVFCAAYIRSLSPLLYFSAPPERSLTWNFNTITTMLIPSHSLILAFLALVPLSVSADRHNPAPANRNKHRRQQTSQRPSFASNNTMAKRDGVNSGVATFFKPSALLDFLLGIELGSTGELT